MPNEGFQVTRGADLPDGWRQMLNRGQIPRGFGDWLHRRQLNLEQRAGIPLTVSADNPVVDSESNEGGGLSAEVDPFVTPPTVYWPLDEGVGTAIGDESQMGHEVDGIADGNASWVTGRRDGSSALSLPGADTSQIDFGTGVTEIHLGGSQQWSFEAWIKHTGSGASNILNRVNGSPSLDTGSRSFYIGGTDGYLALYIEGAAPSVANVNPIDLRDGEWHHIKFGNWNSGLHMMVDGLRQFAGSISWGTDNTAWSLTMGHTAAYSSTLVIQDALYRQLT